MTNNIKKIALLIVEKSGAEEACLAHNQNVGGSKPPSSIFDNIFQWSTYCNTCSGIEWLYISLFFTYIFLYT